MEVLERAILKELIEKDPEFLNSLRSKSKETLQQLKVYCKELDDELYKNFSYIRDLYEL